MTVYEIKSPAPGIHVCFVHIPSFIRSFLPHIVDADFLDGRQLIREKIDLDARTLNPEYFHVQEIRTANGFKILKKQAEWLAGRLAVKLLVGRLLSPGSCLHDITVSSGETGAPVLDTFPHVPVSISHSHDYAVAGLRSEKSPAFGLDIEKMVPLEFTAVEKTAFSENESALAVNDPVMFFRIWTAKEAYLKYIKKGFYENLKDVEILENQIFHHQMPVTGVCMISKIFQNDYMFTLVWESGPDI